MADLKAILSQLRAERDRLDKAIEAINRIVVTDGTIPARSTRARAGGRRKRRLSPEGRARIVAAARKRWAAVRKTKKAAKS